MKTNLIRVAVAVAIVAGVLGASACHRHHTPGTSADMSKTAPTLRAPSGSKAEAAINEGIMHYEQGHWGVAKTHFERAVQADEQSAEAHYDLALALDKAGDHQAAIQHFKAAQDYGKNNPEIQNSGILQAHLKAKH